MKSKILFYGQRFIWMTLATALVVAICNYLGRTHWETGLWLDSLIIVMCTNTLLFIFLTFAHIDYAKAKDAGNHMAQISIGEIIQGGLVFGGFLGLAEGLLWGPYPLFHPSLSEFWTNMIMIIIPLFIIMLMAVINLRLGILFGVATLTVFFWLVMPNFRGFMTIMPTIMGTILIGRAIKFMLFTKWHKIGQTTAEK